MAKEPTYEQLKQRVKELEKQAVEGKRSEEALQKSEEKYRLMFDTMVSGFVLHEIIYDESGKPVDLWYRDVNPAHEKLTGLKTKEIIGKKVSECYPNLENLWLEGYAQVDKTGKPMLIENYVEGLKNWYSVYAYRTKPGFIAATFQNITERKQAEEKLIRSEKRFKDLVFSSSDWIWEIDKDGKYTFASEKVEMILGYSPEELIGKTPFDFMSKVKAKTIGEDFKKIVSEKKPIVDLENWNLSKDGKEVCLLTNGIPLLDEKGSLIGFRGVDKDITKRKQAADALQESEEKYRSMMEAMDEAAYICSLDFRIVYMNPAMTKMIGYDVTGEPCHKVIHGLDEKCPWCVHAKVMEGNHIKIEVVSPKNGKTYHISNSPIFHTDGSVSNLSVFRDITEIKKMEAQLRQAQKMEAIGTLAGGVAHDFNNILTIIIGNAALALMSVGKDGPLQNKIEEIITAGERAASLTRQLLAFSRKQVIQLKILDLNELLTDIEKMLVRLIEEDIELLMIPGPALWQVEADHGQMEQVIMNLVVNAKDAMPMGGKLTIETANVDLDESYFREHGIKEQPGTYVMVAVSDTGIGMDKETQEHIFEPFFTTKEVGKGTGLGLSTIYGIVKQNKGFVWVYSEPGQGSTFKIFLPKVKGDAESEEKERTSVDDLSGTETVLIVEDDTNLRNLVRKTLRNYGHKVLEAENGEDALRVSQAHEGQIDLMITDVVMPKMGGKELAERLQPLYPRMKIIYMSGYTDDAIVQHGVLTPGLNFLQKPFSPESLARKVREILNTE